MTTKVLRRHLAAARAIQRRISAALDLGPKVRGRNDAVRRMIEKSGGSRRAPKLYLKTRKAARARRVAREVRLLAAAA